jgi:hypothetical protein
MKFKQNDAAVELASSRMSRAMKTNKSPWAIDESSLL